MTDNNSFYVVANMPVSEIQKCKDASEYQKRYAKSFDTDGNGIFSQQEADLFNATTFSEGTNNTVTFCTQVEYKKFIGTKSEIVEKTFADNPNNIKYDAKDSIFNNKTIVPCKKTHYELTKSNRDVLPDTETINGVKFDVRTGKSYSEIYYNNQYMNCVTLHDGTKVIYPNGENGSVEQHNQGGTSSHIGYSWSGGYDINDGTYTTAGNGGYKIKSKHSDDNYYTTFKNLENAYIIGTKGHDRYGLEKCSNCTVDNSKEDNTQDNVYISGGNDNYVKQSSKDVTRMAMDGFDVLVKGKQNVNTNSIKDDCDGVKYVRHFFKQNEWWGIKNRNLEYKAETLNQGIENWH